MAESRGRGARWSAAALAAPVAAGLFAGTTAWSQHHNPLASAAEPTLTPVTPSPTTDAELAALKQRLAVTSATIDRLARQVKAVKARAAALESGGSPSASASASRTAAGKAAAAAGGATVGGSTGTASGTSTSHTTTRSTSTGGTRSAPAAAPKKKAPAPVATKPAPAPKPKPAPAPAPAPAPTPAPSQHGGTGASGTG